MWGRVGPFLAIGGGAVFVLGFNVFVLEGKFFFGFASSPRGAKIFLGFVNWTERLLFLSWVFNPKREAEDPGVCDSMVEGRVVN